MSPPPARGKVLQVAPWRDGILVVDSDGRLWFGIPNYDTTVSTIPVLHWKELTTPDMGALPIEAAVPPFGRAPDLK